MANFQKQIPLIKVAEGGLSKDPTDYAAHWPVPDGSGYHTNKGVTWQTFSTMATKLGYVATPALFYQMPDDIWLKIYKVGYWDMVQGDKIDSQAVAGLLVEIAWGSGPGEAGRMTQVVLRNRGHNISIYPSVGPLTLLGINDEIKKDEKGFYQALFNERMRILETLPDWPGHGEGWTIRMNKIFSSGIEWISENPGKSTGSIFFLAAALTSLIYRKQISNLFNS
jgi:lysozyme family protein